MGYIGDARHTNLYQYPIAQWEAQELASIEHRHNDLLNNVAPKVLYTNLQTSCKMGTCHYSNGVITMHIPGQNLGTLAHELAHLNYMHERGHGYYFKEAHSSILDSFEDYAKERR